MKKVFTRKSILLAILLVFTGLTYAKNIRIAKTEVIAGDDSSSYTTYHYDKFNRLKKIATVDSGSTMISRWDKIFYNQLDQYDSVVTYSNNSPSPIKTCRFTYDDNENITRFEQNGINDLGSFSIAFNINYDDNNLLNSMYVDWSFFSGMPDGFIADFENISWENGNITSFDLIMLDNRFEIELIYDDKNNFDRLIHIDEITDFIFSSNQNNVKYAIFPFDELYWAAGTKVLDFELEYTKFNEVKNYINKAALFETNDNIIHYTYENAPQCHGKKHCKKHNNCENKVINVSPNPFVNTISVDLPGEKGILTITNIYGKKVLSKKVNSSTNSYNLSHLPKGIYFIYFQTNNKTYFKQIIKK
jgi:hypothetical protein